MYFNNNYVAYIQIIFKMQKALKCFLTNKLCVILYFLVPGWWIAHLLRTVQIQLQIIHFYIIQFIQIEKLRQKGWFIYFSVKHCTYHPVLNSTCASNRATTGAVAALHPLTLDLISPSCLVWRTTLMNPGPCWAFVSSTKLCKCSFSSTKKKQIHEHTLMLVWSYST